MNSCRMGWVAVMVLGVGFAAGAAADVVIIGGLSNFDVYNRTGGECTEFEFELEGPHPEDVYHTYRNGNYGSPTITPLPGNIGIRVVYSHPRHATANNAVEHFGVSLSGAHRVTAQRFNWVPGSLNPPYPPPPPPPPPPPLALPQLSTEILYLPSGPMIRETLTNVDPLRRSIWVLRRETEASREVQLEELMVDDPLIQGATPIDAERELLAFGVPLVFEEDAPPPNELRSEVLVYEVYNASQQMIGTVMSAAVAVAPTCPQQYLPAVLSQPQNATGLLDGEATFTTSASDPYGGQLEYQWRHEGIDLIGEDQPTLRVEPISLTSAGAYDCVITNICGIVRTDCAYLTVLHPCSFLEQPQSATACPGDTVAFTVLLQGPQEEFFWRQRGAEIPPSDPHFQMTISPDGLRSTLTILGVRPEDAGTYDVLLAGDCEIYASDTALLTFHSGGPGDLNCDCLVNNFDIDPFVQCILAGACG